MKALKALKDLSASDEAQYGRKRASIVINQAGVLPSLRGGIDHIQRYYNIYTNMSRIKAYKIAASILLEAQAEMIIANAALIREKQYMKAVIMLDLWQGYYTELTLEMPEYDLVASKLKHVKDNWLRLGKQR